MPHSNFEECFTSPSFIFFLPAHSVSKILILIPAKPFSYIPRITTRFPLLKAFLIVSSGNELPTSPETASSPDQTSLASRCFRTHFLMHTHLCRFFPPFLFTYYWFEFVFFFFLLLVLKLFYQIRSRYSHTVLFFFFIFEAEERKTYTKDQKTHFRGEYTKTMLSYV